MPKVHNKLSLKVKKDKIEYRICQNSGITIFFILKPLEK